MLWAAARKVTGGLKLFHDKYAKNVGEYQEYAAQFDEAVRHNEQLRSCISKVGHLYICVCVCV